MATKKGKRSTKRVGTLKAKSLTAGQARKIKGGLGRPKPGGRG